MLLEFFVLAAYLLDEHAAYGADTADEEVEHLIVGQEERVVQDVKRLAQRFALDDKGDIGLRGSLGTGDDRDTATPQRAKQFARHARRMAHVFADDGHRGKSAFRVHGKHGSGLYLLGKLAVQHVDSLFGIGVADTDGGGVLG